MRVISHAADDSFLDDVHRAFAEGAEALVISLVGCKSGKVLPVAEATVIAHDAGATVIVDCAQALGQYPVDVRALGADAYAFLGYKWLHGPLGVGAFWIEDPERFESTRFGWRSQSAMDLEGGVTLKPEASRFETGTVDAGAFFGLRQTSRSTSVWARRWVSGCVRCARACSSVSPSSRSTSSRDRATPPASSSPRHVARRRWRSSSGCGASSGSS